MPGSVTRTGEGSVLRDLFLWSVVFFSLVVRLATIGHDLPYVAYGDEVRFVYDALKMGTGDLNPHYFIYPTLWYYVYLASFGAYFIIGKMTGSFPGTEDFILAYIRDPSVFMLIARSYDVVMSLITIIGVYCVARRLYDRTTARLAAAFFAVMPLVIRHSTNAIVDIPLTGFVIVTLYYLVRAMQTGKMSDYLLSGVAFGFAVSSKYTGFSLFVPLLVSFFLGRREASRGHRSGLIKPALALLVAGAIFLLTCPFIIIDTASFLRDIGYQKFAASVGFLGWGHREPAFMVFVRTHLPNGAGIILYLLSIAGAIVGIWKRERGVFLVLSFALPYLVAMGAYRLEYPRYILPVLPVVALFSGSMIARAVSAVKRYRLPVTIGIALVCAAPSVIASFNEFNLLRSKDSRCFAREWIEKNVPHGSRILTPILFDLQRTPENLRRLHAEKKAIRTEYAYRAYSDWYFRLLERSAAERPGYDVEVIPESVSYLAQKGDFPEEWLTPEKVKAILRPEQYDFVVYDGYVAGPFEGELAKAVPERLRYWVDFYRELSSYPVVWQINSSEKKLRGVVLRIYKTR